MKQIIVTELIPGCGAIMVTKELQEHTGNPLQSH